jgi:hypothetical protein
MTVTIPEGVNTASQRIPCSIQYAPDLRRTAKDYSCDVTWVHVTPGTGLILAHAGWTTYQFDCSEREGNLGESIKQVLIGLGCFTHNGVPDKLIDTRTPTNVAYEVNKILGTKRSLFHPINA